VGIGWVVDEYGVDDVDQRHDIMIRKHQLFSLVHSNLAGIGRSH
jgi:hypothetical protein